MPEPCQCHASFAAVSPTHPGHCCFWPLAQSCHPEAVAEWERQRVLRHPRVPDEDVSFPDDPSPAGGLDTWEF